MVKQKANGAYRPTPWGEARNFWYWAGGQPLTIPNKTGFHYTTPKNSTFERRRVYSQYFSDMGITLDQSYPPENGEAMLDLSADLAWPNNRACGFLGDIETAHSENATTPFKMTIVARIAFMEEGGAEVSRHVCKIFDWASNFMTAGPTVISIGDPVCGLIAAP